MGVNIGGGGEVAVTQPFLNLLHGNAVCQKKAGAAMPLRYNYDKPEKPRIRWLPMQAAATQMVRAKISGSIINITSTRAERAYPCDAVYGGVKAALNRASQSAALDLAPYGIRVNCVAPGAIAVRSKEYLQKLSIIPVDFWDELGTRIPLGRSGTPEDIANAVAFLASDQASYITGEILRVDGGLILPGMPEQRGHSWGATKKENQ